MPVKKVRTATRPKNTKTYSYTQSEVIENIRAFTGMNKRSQARELAEDLHLFIVDALKKGYKIPLIGLGKMYVRQTKARMGRNPATGEIIQIAPKKRVRFTAAKALKEAVL
ncbi:MAG: HU family DNA-binding protein [Oligoflexia bacterium]|nr:HU family DNA-binding protein [Oligoflexia bacterium]